MKKIITIIFILLLTGCYNYKELNKLGIVSSISIDKKEDKYLIGAQVMNIKDEKESESSKVIVFESTGSTIEEALRKMTNTADKKLYGGHLSKLVLSEEIAKEGIINVIDLFQRLTEIKDEFTITISKGIQALDVIKVLTNGSTPADYVSNAIENSSIESALTYSSKLDEFLSFYLKKYIDPVVSVIEVENFNNKGTTINNSETTSPKTRIELSNIAITKDGKLEKYLDNDETIGYNFLMNKIDQMIVPVKCDDNNYASISILSSKTKSNVNKSNNKFIINFYIEGNANINEYNCKKEINEETITELEKLTNNKIKDYINKVLDVKTDSEFLGLKRIIYLDYPNYNNEKYNLETKININISRKGEISNSSKGEKYEH